MSFSFITEPETYNNDLILSCHFSIATEAVYRLEVGVTYGGGNIGNCGSYKTPAEIETACNIDQTCIGYSTHRDLNTGAEPFAENGFYPWCLKKTEGQTRIAPNQNYYRKIQQMVT